MAQWGFNPEEGELALKSTKRVLKLLNDDPKLDHAKKINRLEIILNILCDDKDEISKYRKFVGTVRLLSIKHKYDISNDILIKCLICCCSYSVYCRINNYIEDYNNINSIMTWIRSKHIGNISVYIEMLMRRILCNL